MVGGFTTLKKMTLRYVIYVCMQNTIKCFYQTKMRNRHLQHQDLVTGKIQLNQKKGSLNMNRKKLTEMLFHCFLKIPMTNDLIQIIRSTLKLQHHQKRKTLIKIMSSTRYLTRQGIALRGQ